MIGELFTALTKGAMRKFANAIADKCTKPEGNSYPDELVQKFQKFMRHRVYIYLVNEVERDYLGQDGQGMSPKQKWNASQKIFRERFSDIRKQHFNLKNKLMGEAEEESQNQIGNLHPNYDRYEKLVSASHFEAFVVVVMSEWAKRGDIYLNADDDTQTESFEIQHNSIDEAIKHGITTMDQIEAEEI